MCVMHVWTRLGIAVLFAVGLPLLASEQANAQCIRTPVLDVTPKSAAPGAPVTVTGSGFVAGCPDVVANGVPQDPFHPETGIDIEFTQGSESVVLATVDADSTNSFQLTVDIPTTAKAGTATISADEATADVVVGATRGLPRTGFPTVAVTSVGVGLIALGALLRNRARAVAVSRQQ
jgi:hypothetical protein